MFSWPIPRMNDNYRYIMSVYKEMNEDVQKVSALRLLQNGFWIILYYRGTSKEFKKGPYKGGLCKTSRA